MTLVNTIALLVRRLGINWRSYLYDFENSRIIINGNYTGRLNPAVFKDGSIYAFSYTIRLNGTSVPSLIGGKVDSMVIRKEYSVIRLEYRLVNGGESRIILDFSGFKYSNEATALWLGTGASLADDGGFIFFQPSLGLTDVDDPDSAGVAMSLLMLVIASKPDYAERLSDLLNLASSYAGDSLVSISLANLDSVIRRIINALEPVYIARA